MASYARGSAIYKEITQNKRSRKHRTINKGRRKKKKDTKIKKQKRRNNGN